MIELNRGDRVRSIKPVYVRPGTGTVIDIDTADYVAKDGVPQLTVNFGGRKVQLSADEVWPSPSSGTTESNDPRAPRGTRLERILSRLFTYEAINSQPGKGASLHRWVLWHSERSGRGIYIHKFVASEEGRAPHDHPKAFLSIGIRGGYSEARLTTDEAAAGTKAKLSKYIAPWIRRFGPNHIHRIRLPGYPPKPCWTVVLTGPRTAAWGFWQRAGATAARHKIPEAEYHRAEAAAEAPRNNRTV